MAKKTHHPEMLEGAPLRYAPTNEFGVVFLFSHLAKRMQVQVESVQAGYPDCIVYQRVGGNEKRIRIEFEFRSSNFKAHRHPADGCDWIVCWEHDWPGVPPHLKVVELRRYYSRGFNVWLVTGPSEDGNWPVRGKMAFGNRVAKGDLVFFYEGHPNQWFRYAYKVTDEGEIRTYETDGKRGKDSFYGHAVRRICVFDPPLQLKTLMADQLLATSGLFAGKFNRKITEHWWRFHELILRKYPAHASALAPFDPTRV